MLIKKWETRVVKLSDVVPQSNNPRVIDLASLNGLRASLGRFGYVELVVWNERTRHIISGHQRFAVLQQEGVIEAPMIVVDMSVEEEMGASLTMNNPMIEGEFDEPVMELLGQIEKSVPELFKAVRMEELRSSLDKSMDRNLGDSDTSDRGDDVDWDTECPCCGNKWKINSSDILIQKGNV